MGKIEDILVAQAKGFHRYGFTLEEMNVANFGEHTLKAIAHLIDPLRIRNNKKVYTVKEAYEMVAGLNAAQAEDIVGCGLARREVISQNFA